MQSQSRRDSTEGTKKVKAKDLRIIVLGGDALPWRGKDEDWRGTSHHAGKGQGAWKRRM